MYRRRYESCRSSKLKLHLKTKKNKLWRKTIFNMADGIITPWNVTRSRHWFRQVTALCNVTYGSGIMTVNSPSSSILQCDTYLLDHDIEFARWQHPAICWHAKKVALGWHTMEFVQTSAILEFYIWFRFWPYYCSRHVILQRCEILSKSDHPQQKKWRYVDFQDGRSQPFWILGVQ